MLAISPSPSPSEETNPSSLEQNDISKQPKNQLQLHLPIRYKPGKLATLGQPKHQKTKPIVWFAAVLCFIFSLLLIFFGIAILICYFALKPRNPLFDISNASINAVYFDSTPYLNGEFNLLTNFSNPNRRVGVRFKSLEIELFFSERLIASQSIKGFSQKPRETRLQSVKFISRLVFLPQDVGVKLQKQIQNNRLNFNVKGTFKVEINIALFHSSYLLHSNCQIEMTAPQTGALVARQCTTYR